MLIEVLCVCRRRPRWVADATAEYAKRLPRDLELSFAFVAPGRDGMSAAARRDEEAARVLKRIKGGSPIVALDVAGREPDSETLAAWLAEWRQSFPRLALVIGGADGLGSALLERARLRWSLSRLTLPHLLVQVVLAEQIYRAWTILDGHPYHRA